MASKQFHVDLVLTLCLPFPQEGDKAETRTKSIAEMEDVE